MRTFAGVELGGTKIVCGLSTEDGELLERVRLDTEDPERSLPAVLATLQRFECTHGRYSGLGIGAFGPVYLNRKAANFGRIGQTPKLAWRGRDLFAYFRESQSAPIVLDTDVTMAAFGESTWGVAAEAGSIVYLTVGTGIGAGVLIDDVPVHGLMHPEVGHIRVPRAAGDEYAGGCPQHGDCVEGLTAGPAILARWGKSLGELPDGHPAFEQTAHYISHLVTNSVLFYAPEKIVLGGGVMANAALYPVIRARVQALLYGYVALPEIEHDIEELIVAPGLGDNAGVLGAAAMAMITAS